MRVLRVTAQWVAPTESLNAILTSDIHPAPVGDLHYYMQFNSSFPQRPNDRSDAAWASIFPGKKGFIRHPELAPDVAGIAVFLELQCLVFLWSIYIVSGTDDTLGHAPGSILGFLRRHTHGN
jgi:hypothetical protein